VPEGLREHAASGQAIAQARFSDALGIEERRRGHRRAEEAVVVGVHVMFGEPGKMRNEGLDGLRIEAGPRRLRDQLRLRNEMQVRRVGLQPRRRLARMEDIDTPKERREALDRAEAQPQLVVVAKAGLPRTPGRVAFPLAAKILLALLRQLTVLVVDPKIDEIDVDGRNPK
jgi:hypothetical protein